MVFVNNYLAFRGLVGGVIDPSNRDAYLIGKIDHPALRGQPDYEAKEGISVGTLAAQLKQFFFEAGKSLAKEHPQSGKRLQQASTHWLRHTHGSHAVASGTPIEIVQNNLGHANLATTTIYVTTEHKRRHAAMQAFWNQAGRGGN
jgi:integrase